MGQYFTQPNKNIIGEKNPNFRTGLAINGKRSSLYPSWMNMKQRCTNPNHPKYYRYGGRGISICNEWLSHHSFFDWAVDNGWFEGASLDRIDNDGNYSPENCKWVTLSTNSKKKRTTKITLEDAHVIRYRLLKGETCATIAKDYPICESGISQIKRGNTHVPCGALVGMA